MRAGLLDARGLARLPVREGRRKLRLAPPQSQRLHLRLRACAATCASASSTAPGCGARELTACRRALHDTPAATQPDGQRQPRLPERFLHPRCATGSSCAHVFGCARSASAAASWASTASSTSTSMRRRARPPASARAPCSSKAGLMFGTEPDVPALGHAAAAARHRLPRGRRALRLAPGHRGPLLGGALTFRRRGQRAVRRRALRSDRGELEASPGSGPLRGQDHEQILLRTLLSPAAAALAGGCAPHREVRLRTTR